MIVHLVSIITLILGCIASRAVCHAQELPAFSDPLFSTGSNHRNSFCARHEAVENGDIPIRDALRGMTNITVGFVTVQMNQKTGGIDPDNPDIAIELMDEVSHRAGFLYRNSFGVFPPPTGNSTWTELLEWGASVYDIMGIRFVETTNRLERGILFPAGWYDSNLILIMRQSENNENAVDLWALFRPFTSEVWGLIALTTIISGFVYYVLDYFDSRIKKKSMHFGLEDSLFYAAFTFNGHYTQQPKSRGTRILVFSMAFFFLLIVAAYTANMASFLVLRNQPSIVINGIQDVIRNDLRICVRRATASDEHLQSYRISSLRIHRTENTGDEFLALQEGLCDVILTPLGYWEEARRDARLNPHCDLEHVGRMVSFQSAGFAIGDSEQSCSSLLRDVLHLHLSELINSPMFDVIWEEYLSKGDTSNCVAAATADATDDNENEVSMGIENLSGMFLIHFMALLLALVLTIIQVCCQPAPRRKAMLSELQSAFLKCRGLKQTASIANRKSSRSVTGVGDVENDADNESDEDDSSEEVANVASVMSKVEQLVEQTEKSNQQHQIDMERITQLMDRLEKKEQQHREQMEQSQKLHEEEMKRMSNRMEQKEQRHVELIEAMQRQMASMEEKLTNISRPRE